MLGCFLIGGNIVALRKIWQIREKNKDKTEYLAKEMGISKVLAQLLINRGLEDLEKAEYFLKGNLDNLTSPFEIAGVRPAIERVRKAIHDKEKIVIYGDYDVDGIAGTSLLVETLKILGARVDFYIPDRLEEGYGLNLAALQQLATEKVDLVITVDCGIASHLEISKGQELGLEFIVTDHHLPSEELPPCIVINPTLEKKEVNWQGLAGVGVAFKLVQGLLEDILGSSLGRKKAFEFLDLVALGTIADIVPLKGENRILVKYGLVEMAKGKRLGINKLCEVSKINLQTIAAGQVGFGLAPRLNASGRIGNPGLGVQLLLSQQEKEAEEIALKLNSENQNRQSIEAKITQDAIHMVENMDLDKEQCIILMSPDWHPGVIGIVASRLVEKYYRPTILLTIANGVLKGSGRSIPGFHLYEALSHCQNLLENFGGHSQAAGLSLTPENLAAFRTKINRLASSILKEEDLIPAILLDGEINLEEVNFQLLEEISQLEPFGASNPEPLLAYRRGEIKDYRQVGNGGKHLKLRVKAGDSYWDGIGFNLASHLEIVASQEPVDLAFALDKNHWQGKTELQLILKDLKPYKEADNPQKTVGFLDRLFIEGEKYLHDDPYRDINEKDSFYTKIVGVTFEERQDFIKNLVEGAKVKLIREPENTFDPFAIAVYVDTLKIGYLKKELAHHLSKSLDEGIEYTGRVSQVTGGQNEKNYGVNLFIKKVSVDNEQSLAQLRVKREKFSQLSPLEIKAHIKECLIGSNDYRPKQLEAIASLEAGYNTLAIFGTGRGKSAVFQTRSAFLALTQRRVSIIVYPLRALVNDQYLTLKSKFAPLGLTVYKGTGSLEREERLEFFTQLKEGQIDIVLTTPEFLSCNREKFGLIRDKLGLLVIDECHHLVSRRSGYKQLPQTISYLGNPRVLAVTATANDEVSEQIIRKLGIEKLIIDKHVRENLQLIDSRFCNDKIGYIKKLLTTGERIVVYVNSRKVAYSLAADLRRDMPFYKECIGYYHGGLSSEDRLGVEYLFREGGLQLIVTTSAFGEGIDIPDIQNVVIYHLSFSTSEYNQLAGRAGRNGQPAKIHLIYGKKDKDLNELILAGLAPNREQMGKFYLMLKKIAEKNHPITFSNKEIAEWAKVYKIPGVMDKTVSHWLGILDDLNLIEKEVNGNKRLIWMNFNAKKVDLKDSIRYVEGMDENSLYEEFLSLAYLKDPRPLEEIIKRPIYPLKY